MIASYHSYYDIDHRNIACFDNQEAANKFIEEAGDDIEDGWEYYIQAMPLYPSLEQWKQTALK